MVSKLKMFHIICIFVMLIAEPHRAFASTYEVQQLITGMQQFGGNLYTKLAADKKYLPKNILISPLSIQTCLIMTRLGAQCKTALQIDLVLGLPAQERSTLAANYHAVLAKYEDSSVLKMANKIYAMTGYRAHYEFKELLAEHFNSSVGFVDFRRNQTAAKTINSWVEERTDDLIKDLIDPSTLDGSTRLVLVNAIHFKGEWAHQFPKRSTTESDFYLDDTNTIKVQMMRILRNFNYAFLPDLDAQALEMPYKDSDLSMLIILPNQYTGLVELEEKLKTTSFNNIENEMTYTKVRLRMPKFKAEYEVQLQKPLSEMGMQRMFSAKAQFGKMLIPKEDLYISSVVHKAFIEVNEEGTKAAATTGFAAAVALSIDYIDFVVDHGFIYAIRSKDGAVLFQGRQTFVE